MVAKSLKSAETLKKKGHQGKSLILPSSQNPFRRRKVPDLTHPLTQHSINTECKIIPGKCYSTRQKLVLKSDVDDF